MKVRLAFEFPTPQKPMFIKFPPPPPWVCPEGDGTQEDLQQQFSTKTLHCNIGTMLQLFQTISQQCCNLCCTKNRTLKNRRCESFRVT